MKPISLSRASRPNAALVLATVLSALFGAACSSSDSLVVTTPTSRASAGSMNLSGDLACRVHSQINAYRESNGRGSLQRHAGLDRLAQQHSESMKNVAGGFGPKGGKTYISHDGFGGRADSARQGLGIDRLGENVIYRYGCTGDPSAAIVRGWLESSGHRHNIRAKGWTVTGIGVTRDHAGQVWVTQLFGTPPNDGSIGAGSQWHTGQPW